MGVVGAVGAGVVGVGVVDAVVGVGVVDAVVDVGTGLFGGRCPVSVVMMAAAASWAASAVGRGRGRVACTRWGGDVVDKGRWGSRGR